MNSHAVVEGVVGWARARHVRMRNDRTKRHIVAEGAEEWENRWSGCVVLRVAHH